MNIYIYIYISIYISIYTSIYIYILQDVPDTERDFYMFKGNEAADALAKRGAALHPLDSDDVNDFKRTQTDLVCLAHHVLGVMSSFDFVSPHKLRRIPKMTSLSSLTGQQYQGHDFKWAGRFWRCQICLLRVSPFSGSHPKVLSKCGGLSKLAQVLQNPGGHRLFVAPIQGGGTLVYCGTCWGFAESLPRKLLTPCACCPGPFGPTARTRIKRGQHPGDPHRLIFRPFPIEAFV